MLGGPGSGKTTLLAAVCGMVRPSRGRIRLDGRVFADALAGVHLPAHDRPVALLTAWPLLFDDVSVRENVALALRLRRVGPAEADTEARRRLDEVEAEALADRAAGELTAGQAQQVSLARALATNPELVLLDDPLARLDPASAQRLRRLLRSLLWDRVTLLATADERDARAVGDRIAPLDAGRVACQRPCGRGVTPYTRNYRP